MFACADSGVSPGAAVSVEVGCTSTPLVLVDGALVDSGAVDAPNSVMLVCAPPLLLIVTPGAT